MAEVSVKQLATDIDTPVDRLLQQVVDAGIVKSKADDMVSESEKQTLLAHLKKQHGGDEVTAPARMTLQRKTKSTLSVQGTGGKNKEVQVEVRKSRTYVRRSALEDEQRQARHDLQRADQDQQRQRGDHLEVDEGFEADPAGLLQVGVAGQAYHQSAEQQRRDHRRRQLDVQGRHPPRRRDEQPPPPAAGAAARAPAP